MDKLTKEEAFLIIREVGWGYLSTVEGDQPRVRPMMPHLLTNEGELLVAMLGRSRTIAQIKINPKVEMCFVDRKMWYCRVTGIAFMSNDIVKKKAAFEKIPMLSQFLKGPEDPKYLLAVIKMKSMETLSPHSSLPQKIVF